MAKKRKTMYRDIDPDKKFRSRVVTKFINGLLWCGKKRQAESIFYDALKEMGNGSEQEGFSMFSKAVENVKPKLEVKTRRIGGANYQVPMEVTPVRKQALAIRWIISFARGKKGMSIKDKLVTELKAAANNEGAAINKKEETHKMAAANRAFAHFRW